MRRMFVTDIRVTYRPAACYSRIVAERRCRVVEHNDRISG